MLLLIVSSPRNTSQWVSIIFRRLFLNFIYKWKHTVHIFLWLASFFFYFMFLRFIHIVVLCSFALLYGFQLDEYTRIFFNSTSIDGHLFCAFLFLFLLLLVFFVCGNSVQWTIVRRCPLSLIHRSVFMVYTYEWDCLLIGSSFLLSNIQLCSRAVTSG